LKRAELSLIFAALVIKCSANASNMVDLGSSISDGMVVGHMTNESWKSIGQFKPYLSSGLTNCVELN